MSGCSRGGRWAPRRARPSSPLRGPDLGQVRGRPRTPEARSRGPHQKGASCRERPSQLLPRRGRDHARDPRGPQTRPTARPGPRPGRTLHAAAAGLQHAGVHARPRLRRELVAREVGVVGRADEVVAERPRHVLVHVVVARVEDVPGRAPCVVREACGGPVRGGSARGPALGSGPTSGLRSGPPAPMPRGTRRVLSGPPQHSGAEATPTHRRCPAPPYSCSLGRARTVR